jgi:hypothetical protein
MAAAEIYVDAAVGRPAVTKVLGVTPAMTNHDDTWVVSWAWTVVYAPPGTTAAFSNPALANPTYGPLDQPGTYWLRLIVNGATGDWLSDTEVDEIVIRVADPNGLFYPAPGETTQGGPRGWAEELLNGMNATLAAISAMFGANTLQGAYNASVPPRITIDPAVGPVDIRRAIASPGPILTVTDGAGIGATFTNYGRLAMTSTLGAGTVGIGVATASVAGLLLQLIGVGGTFDVAWDGALHGQATFGVGSANYACELRSTGYPFLWRLYDASVGIGIEATFDQYGSLFLQGDNLGAGNALIEGYVENWVPHFLHLKNGSTGEEITITAAGALQLVATTPPYLIEAQGVAATTGMLRLRNNAGAQSFIIDAVGKIQARMDAGAGDRGLSLACLAGTVVDSAIPVDVHSGGITSTFRIYGDGRLRLEPEAIAVTAAASRDWLRLIMSTVGTIANAETASGVFVDGDALNVDAGGTWRGVRSSMQGVLAGDQACFSAEPKTQDQVAYRVGYGVAGVSPFIGYSHLQACSFYSEVLVTGALSWQLTHAIVTGATAHQLCLTAGDSAEAYVVLPPNATITEVSVRVYQSTLHKQVTVQLIAQDDSNGANAQNQTVVATGTSADAEGDSDVVLAPAATITSAPTSATQQSYRVQVVSGNVGDKIYAGHVKYTYAELMHGA